MTFDCPRCHGPADERFYGPCSSCREQLRAIGPRVDDPSFVGRERRLAAAAEAEEALQQRMRDVWPEHLIGGS